MKINLCFDAKCENFGSLARGNYHVKIFFLKCEDNKYTNSMLGKL